MSKSLGFYGSGYRIPDGIQLGFAERARNGKTKFLFVEYFEERADKKEEIDVIDRLSKRFRNELKTEKFKNSDAKKWASNKEITKVDKSFKQILKKFQKTAYFER